MRGKTENDRSIVKKVSCNLLVSRREHRHNLELGGRRSGSNEGSQAGEKRKVEIQRLPSPSAISKGTQFSKAINLLPFYTESQALGIRDDEDNEFSNGAAKSSIRINRERKFTQKELLHLNKVPNYEYLKPKPEDK
jgi:hypothetical protein